ncbi:Protein painting of fourth [Acromyrmex echinatior]|uniref:Protein painting of fourth n=1 Tax=Acromyrmex echinatior TaxID=103372 RepID=F4W587_ACREC|nr:Protein painting of fourth [Acromyrmex echinatior]
MNHFVSDSMKRAMPEENHETKRVFVKQENFGYNAPSYANYSSSSSSSSISSTNAQSLPGQPPLPPMPPPSSRIPPPSHVFESVPSQVTPIQAWIHPTWQWIASQTSMPPPTPREVTNTIQREMPLRGNYVRHERFAHNRSNMYVHRNNFHRKKRPVRFGLSQGQFDQNTYLGLQWQRNVYTAAANDDIRNHMTVPLSSHSISPIPSGIINNMTRHDEEMEDQDEKIVKKNKQRKPMSQSYPSKPWNREDAERALMIENEYNMKNKVNAQSLIIKFPDPDLNKDIVKLFHSGIRNIHFQNPSGPRYCFIQMAKNVNIDEAMKELEKIKFGTGYLKVEKKAVRNEDVRNTKPEDINPYNLYIGNLPTFVKANEIKSKFPKARVDVSRARKLKNTQFAFMRYNSVDDAIADYKKAYGLMWDTRSIIVKFRRKEGNSYLPEELKPDVKKIKEESNNIALVKREQNMNHIEFKSNVNKSKDEENNISREDKINYDKLSTNQDTNNVEARLQDNSIKAQIKLASQIEENTNSNSSSVPTSITTDKTIQEQQLWASSEISSTSENPLSCPTQTNATEETMMLTQIKEEPIDYDEINIICAHSVHRLYTTPNQNFPKTDSDQETSTHTYQHHHQVFSI